MDQRSENTRRIAKNTLMLYIRMLFNMLVALYTSRVVLNTLGVEDYGIYNVVGGLVSMFSLISGSLSAAVSRFLTFELGRRDAERLKQVFSTSLFIHVVLAAVIVVLVETVGVWFLNTHMTIPTERLHAARWVLHTSLAGFALSLVSVPYNASIVSQHMSVYAYLGILNTLLWLAVVIFLKYSSGPFDKLIVYAFLLFGVAVLMQSLYMAYCRKHFEECRFRISFDRKFLKEIGSFAGWNFIGASSGLLKDQGVNILLNIFFGPVVNAARGIANSVNVAVSSFSTNFMTALNPQITKSYAGEDREYAMSLVERGARFSFYIIFILALPILFETEFILDIWLRQYPEHSINFVRLVLLLSLCDILSNTLITLQLATGNIRNYQIVVGGMQLMNFPVSWVCLKAGMQPEAVYVIAIAISLLCLVLRLLFLRKMAGLDIIRYLKNVCCNVLSVSVAAVVIPFILYGIIEDDGWFKLITVSLVSVLCSACSIYAIGCSKNERHFILAKIRMTKDRISR